MLSGLIIAIILSLQIIQTERNSNQVPKSSIIELECSDSSSNRPKIKQNKHEISEHITENLSNSHTEILVDSDQLLDDQPYYFTELDNSDNPNVGYHEYQ